MKRRHYALCGTRAKRMQFLRAKRKEEFEMVAVKNPEIRKAVDTLYQLSSDEQIQAEHERRLKAWRDRASQIEGSFLDGKQEGRRDTARKMKAINLPIDQIISVDISEASIFKIAILEFCGKLLVSVSTALIIAPSSPC